ncbi:hypothetical protein [Christensenella timonensis]|uniref:hypothetical protein n=1 Tax=Christensenella timonensis TaxID=1816678 RepID=UPI0008349B59|nr:hypothetical protein [Christensenella timonensis]
MAGINQEIKELQKLGKMDLIILLGELSEELEGFEKDNREKEDKITALAQENETLRREKEMLAKKNESLMSQVQAANRKLLDLEERPSGTQAIEAVARRMSEIARQTGEQLHLLEEMKNERRQDTAYTARDAQVKAQAIIESAQKRAVGITKQLQQTNLEMLSNMQAAIDRARSGYEAAFEEGNIRAFPPQEEQVVLSAEQARNLLKVLKRFGKPGEATQAEEG